MRSNLAKPITCPSCQTVNEQLEVFCHGCGTPLSLPATPDTSNITPAEGHLRKVRERRPKLVVVLGLWLVFLPFLVLAAITALDILLNYRTSSNFMSFWLSVGSLCLSVFVLYRITKNYLTIPPPPKDVEDEIEEDEMRLSADSADYTDSH